MRCRATFTKPPNSTAPELLRTLLFVTIPLLKRVLIIVLLLRAIDLLRAFETIVATTQGGPGDATYTLPVMIWETAFVNFQMGDAAAASIVLLIMVSVIISALLWVMSREGAIAERRQRDEQTVASALRAAAGRLRVRLDLPHPVDG